MPYIFHDFSGKVRVLLDSHGSNSIKIFVIRNDNGAEVFGCITELERVVLHGNVQFGEKLIARAFG